MKFFICAIFLRKKFISNIKGRFPFIFFLEWFNVCTVQWIVSCFYRLTNLFIRIIKTVVQHLLEYLTIIIIDIGI